MYIANYLMENKNNELVWNDNYITGKLLFLVTNLYIGFNYPSTSQVCLCSFCES